MTSKKIKNEQNSTSTYDDGQAAVLKPVQDQDNQQMSFPVLKRNPGYEYDGDWIRDIHVNTSGVQKRAAEIGARRSIKKEQQALWLLGAICCIDLTTLAGDDTPGKVERLCAKAIAPLRTSLLDGLKEKLAGVLPEPQVLDELTVGAVCVYHNHVARAVEYTKGLIPIAAVSTGFPHGQNPFPQRLEEIRASVAAGAQEIDVVITREYALRSDWKKIYDEVKAYREACGAAHIKVILETGELGTLENVVKASRVSMLAGADFIKTSTGKAGENANLAVSLIMMRQIRDFYERTGIKIGYKPAGGIRTAKDSLAYLALLKEELGDEWMRPELFRFGASSLLTDIERQLSHYITGRYARMDHQPLA